MEQMENASLLERVRTMKETGEALLFQLGNDVFFDPQTPEEHSKLDAVHAAIANHLKALADVQV